MFCAIYLLGAVVEVRHVKGLSRPHFKIQDLPYGAPKPRKVPGGLSQGLVATLGAADRAVIREKLFSDAIPCPFGK